MCQVHSPDACTAPAWSHKMHTNAMRWVYKLHGDPHRALTYGQLHDEQRDHIVVDVIPTTLGLQL